MPDAIEKPTTSPLSVSPCSEIDEHDPMNDPEYHAYLEELAKDCKCRDAPCEGCMAGAPCDAVMGIEIDYDSWGDEELEDDDDEEY